MDDLSVRFVKAVLIINKLGLNGVQGC